MYDAQGNIVRSIDIIAGKEYDYMYENGILTRSAACGEADGSIIVGGGDKYYALASVGVDDTFLGKGSFCIVIVTGRRYVCFRSYKLVFDGNIILCRAGEKSILVHIIIFFSRGNVNRTNDITLCIVGVEKLSTLPTKQGAERT